MPGERVAGRVAGRHALGWLVVGNAVGLYLSLLLLVPGLQAGDWSYGKWLPVHLNVQLFGWTSLPLVAWLVRIYQADSARLARWVEAVIWGWSVALAVGVAHWLAGVTSGKVFLDWKAGALAALVAAQYLLWGVLVAGWRHAAGGWSLRKRVASAIGLLGLLWVPVSLAYASSPTIYPPVDVSTGGPTGASLLGSSLMVVGLMLMLPRVLLEKERAAGGAGVWIFFAFSWLCFGVSEWLGGTHRDAVQLAAMALLLPWVWWLPRDWAGFRWPDGCRSWRLAMLGWWGGLVLTGVWLYLPGVLDHSKFTQVLVGHSHLAMAGFTTSFCMLLLVVLGGRRCGPDWSVWCWHAAALAMIVVLALVGWAEGSDRSWMLGRPSWMVAALLVRSLCGVMMLWVSVFWWKNMK